MKTIPTTVTAASLVLVSLLATGCSSDGERATVAPNQFAGDASSAADEAADPTAASESGAPAVAPRDVEPIAPSPVRITERSDSGDNVTIEMTPRENAPQPAAMESTGRYKIDGVVGQVNGQAIYARTVFEPIEEQLRALSSELTPAQFRLRLIDRRTSEGLREGLISGRVREIVMNALIYGEAERDMNDGQRQALRQILEEKRTEWIRKYGRGSIAAAEAAMLEERGLTLDQALDEFRQGLVVSRYINMQIAPRVNVTRFDIERYYNDNIERFNPPAVRTVRVMMFANEGMAESAHANLEEGDAFAEVASQPTNRYKSEEGGLWGEIEGEGGFRYKQVNEALAALKEGEHSQVIQAGENYWLLFVEKIEGGKQVPLREAQAAIERHLVTVQRAYLTRQYQDELLAQGSYTTLDKMNDRLVDIAMSRYAGQSQVEASNTPSDTGP